MQRIRLSAAGLALVALFTLPGFSPQAQAAQEEVSVPFSDPNRPGRLVVEMLVGSITVSGYDGREVEIEGGGVAGLVEDPAQVPQRAQGFRRVSEGQSTLIVEEADNTIEINAMSPFHTITNLTIRVPTATSIELTSMSGNIRIDNVNGEIQIQAMNGSVSLGGVSGPARVENLHGDIVASFVGTNPSMPTSLSALSGDIDLTLPGSARASLRMRSTSGDVCTDFDFDTGTSSEVTDESTDGRRRIRVGGSVTAALNGGGSEIQLATFQGNIYVRRGD